MKVLKNCIKLSCSVKIYIPSTINVDQNFDSEEWVNKTLRFLSEKFGGSTATKSLGSWLSYGGELVKENVTMIFSYANQDTLEKHIDEVYDYCLHVKAELSQEAIALEVNNELYLV